LIQILRINAPGAAAVADSGTNGSGINRISQVLKGAKAASMRVGGTSGGLKPLI